jgi:hypothetical protein
MIVDPAQAVLARALDLWYQSAPYAGLAQWKCSGFVIPWNTPRTAENLRFLANLAAHMARTDQDHAHNRGTFWGHS